MVPELNVPEFESATIELSSGSPRRRLNLPGLPLAVYREVAAHLCQLPGVSVELLPQTATTFSYQHSQVGGLEMTCSNTDPKVLAQVEKILGYYSDRYGTWQPLPL